MSKKQEIDLNINTEVSDDEFEYESSDDGNEEVTEQEDENNTEVNDDDSLENTNEYDKTNFEDSITKSDKVNMSDTFMDDDDDDDDDIFSVTLQDEDTKDNLIIPDNKRISRNILTKYERVRLLGTRAKQISDGSKVFVKYDGAKSAMELAELELKHKVIPLKVKRPMPNGKYEIWKISELEVL